MTDPGAAGATAALAVTLADVEAARARIAGAVRRTPVIRTAPLREPLPAGDVWLKLEGLQIVGSFKARGAVSKLRTLPADAIRRGIVTASGGNHGLGVAYAGWLAGVPATVYLPGNTPTAKVGQFGAWGARVVVEGAVWDDANRAALAAAEREGLTYFHPFADTAVVAGQGTVGLEIVEDLPDVETVVVAIGGGGLISGVGVALKGLRPGTRLVGVEPVGAPTLHESVRAGRPVTLAAIRTAATTLAPRRSDALNLGLIQATVDDIVLVEDEAMREAARWLWREMGVACELSSAAAVAALRTGAVPVRADERVCAVVCSSGTDGLDLASS